LFVPVPKRELAGPLGDDGAAVAQGVLVQQIPVGHVAWPITWQSPFRTHLLHAQAQVWISNRQ